MLTGIKYAGWVDRYSYKTHHATTSTQKTTQKLRLATLQDIFWLMAGERGWVVFEGAASFPFAIF
jgi:hypothetical protein